MSRLAYGIAFFLVLASPSQAADEEMVSLLHVEYRVGTEVTHSLVLYGTALDPNARSVDDAFVLRLGEREIAAPDAVLAALAYGRRAYSYDSQSGGIAPPPQRTAMCMLGGEPVGRVLSSRYLTYTSETYEITDHAMRPVYGEAENCLFQDLYAPQDAQAHIEAAKAMAILDTLYQVSQTAEAD